MGAPTYLMRNQLKDWIVANCCDVVLTVDDLIECLDRTSGLGAYNCEDVIQRKINEAHETAVARTFCLDATFRPNDANARTPMIDKESGR